MHDSALRGGPSLLADAGDDEPGWVSHGRRAGLNDVAAAPPNETRTHLESFHVEVDTFHFVFAVTEFAWPR